MEPRTVLIVALVMWALLALFDPRAALLALLSLIAIAIAVNHWM